MERFYCFQPLNYNKLPCPVGLIDRGSLGFFLECFTPYRALDLSQFISYQFMQLFKTDTFEMAFVVCFGAYDER